MIASTLAIISGRSCSPQLAELVPQDPDRPVLSNRARAYVELIASCRSQTERSPAVVGQERSRKTLLLTGLRVSETCPLWPRVGRFVYRHGERFYNFRGLRHYKAKFGPVWTPRYLASPGGLALPTVLVDVAALIAGGVAGVVSKRASQQNGS